MILFADEPERDMERVRRALADGRTPRRGSRTRSGASSNQGGARAAAGRPARARGGAGAAGGAREPRRGAGSDSAGSDAGEGRPRPPAARSGAAPAGAGLSGGIVHPLMPAGPFVLPNLLAREGFEVTLYAPARDWSRAISTWCSISSATNALKPERDFTSTDKVCVAGSRRMAPDRPRSRSRTSPGAERGSAGTIIGYDDDLRRRSHGIPSLQVNSPRATARAVDGVQAISSPNRSDAH